MGFAEWDSRQDGALSDRWIDWRDKGLSPRFDGISLASLGQLGACVLGDEASTPLAVLHRGALEHNARRMRSYCMEHGVELAPHGKTTMSPELINLQLANGAWGITAATIWQARALRAFGVRRILLANELLDPPGLQWLARELDNDDSFDFLCYVDSVAGVALMTEALAATRSSRPINVLVEVGFAGGRTGCRTLEGATQLAAAVAESPHLRLRGVGCFEGVLASGRSPADLERVADFLLDVRRVAERLLDDGYVNDDFVVTAGGSAFFDLVVEVLNQPPFQLVLRSGCYITHDHGAYARMSPLSAGDSVGRPLRAALEVWGRVISFPEPSLTIVDVGKRDVSHDSDLPLPLKIFRRSSTRPQPVEGLRVLKLNDQHAYLEVGTASSVQVGDLIGFGISHPCTTFDKWPVLSLVDEDYAIVGAARTFF